jgi:hypothetical protein
MGVELGLSFLVKNRNGRRLKTNKVLRRLFKPKKEEVTGGWMNLIICTLHLMLLRCLKQEGDEHYM